MKINGLALKSVTVCCALLATSAFAQKEQWLRYNTSREGRGYRWITVTTNPPPNVTLPKLNAQPYFARWTTPMDPAGGRWLCLDRSKKSGPYDRVFFDSSGNGKLDDKTAVAANKIEDYETYFGPIKIVFKGEDGPVTYHLVLRAMQFEKRDLQLLCASGGSYSGNVDLGGKKRRIELIDGNVNGSFNDISTNAADSDRVSVADDKIGEHYLGRLLEVDGQLFRVEVPRDGAFIKLQKAENVTLGKVRVPETILEFVALGENGHFVRKPEKGEFTLPVGDYRVHEWTINRKDDRGASWQLMGYNFNQSARFEVTENKPTAVEIGEPIRAALNFDDLATQIGFSLSFKGRLGETVQIRKDNQNPSGPRLTLTSLDGTYRSTNTFEFG